MSFWSSVFGGEAPKTAYEDMYNTLHEKALDVLTDTVEKITPEIETRLKDGIDFLIENVNKPDLTWETFEKFIRSLSESSESTTDEVMQFRNKLEKSTLFAKISQNQELRCMVGGGTQVGKSSTIKILFSIPGEVLSIKDGTSSDTSEVTEYTITVNGCKLIFADTPGLSDSRGEEADKGNISKIIEYVKSNPKIHIFFLFFKMSDMADLHHKDMVHKFEKHLGKEIWNKTIIVLTHANECAPEQYFYNGFYDAFEDRPDFSDKEAWTRYFHSKSRMWKELFSTDVPVVAIENNTRNCMRKEGDLLLIDGTPMWEKFITILLKKISRSKAPILFNLVSGEDAKERKKKLSVELKEKEAKIALLEAEVRSARKVKLEESRKLVSERKLIQEKLKKTTDTENNITNKQKIANKAANNVENDSGDKGWCVLY